MSQILSNIFYIQTNMKLYHWMTKSYARHKAADNFIESFLDLTDKFVEVYIGKYGRPTLSKQDRKLHINNFDDKSISKLLDEGIHIFTNFKNEKDVDLLNIRDEIISLFHQTKYLFTLD